MQIHPIEQPRIVGMETEYGLHPYTRASGFSQAMVDDALPNYLHPGPGGYSEYGRVYQEIRNILEVCTPEVYSLDGLLSAHFAGEELAAEVVRNMCGSTTHLQKNSLDSWGYSRGEHENFMLGSGFNLYDQYKLVSFLAARTVLTGPGTVYSRQIGQYKYAIDARTLVSDGSSPIKSCATDEYSKPLMKSLTAGKLLDDTGATRRIQVVSGSQNMYAFPVAVRMFCTSAVLRLIEHRKYPDKMQFENLSQALAIVPRDLEANRKLAMENGKRYTATQFVSELLERALALDLPADEKKINELAVTKLQALDDGNIDECRGYLEWVDKFELMERHAAKNGYRPLTADSAQLNIRWHERRTDDKRSVIERLRDAGRVALYPYRDALEAAKRMPPDRTRALDRAMYIADAASREHGMAVVSWNMWKSTDQSRSTQANNAWAGYDYRDVA